MSIKLETISSELNKRSATHPVGELQEIRKEIKSLKRISSHGIFSPLTTFERYAFHHGGRKELQYNIGFESSDKDELRYGVAFSFQTNQSLPDISVLVPKVKFFNDFIQMYPEKYIDMRMWHYTDKRSSDYMPALIPAERVAEGVFVFLGKRQPISNLDYELILMDFDRLLPLYKYVESNGNLQPISNVKQSPFKFRSGLTEKKSSTTASHAEGQLNIALLHNDMQKTLYSQLTKKYGQENVGTEIDSGTGTNIDLVVRQGEEFWFYEIKTYHSPRVCIREAIGQLLEYAFWSGSKKVSRLIIAGKVKLDRDGEQYLQTLRNRYSLPIEYEQIVIS
jgi:hypothetical protein